jgi:predicted site-specific integrase-resolvase
MADNTDPLAINSTTLRMRLGISRSTLAKLIKSGTLRQIKTINPKRNRLFNFQEVLNLIATNNNETKK